MDEECVEVGKRISKLRKNLGLTQEKLAEQADISIQFLVQLEHGKKTMTIATLRKLCAALSVSTEYLVNGTEDFPCCEEVKSILAPLSDDDRTHVIKLLSACTKIVTENKSHNNS